VVVGFIAAALPPVGAIWSPDVFAAARFPLPVSICVLGLFTGFASITGDLAESALKRSCGVKDSGTIMPGRGGMLDSIDSLSLAAPVFFIMYNVLFALH
jgi:phosphatidate cytidylyltransferase